MLHRFRHALVGVIAIALGAVAMATLRHADPSVAAFVILAIAVGAGIGLVMVDAPSRGR